MRRRKTLVSLAIIATMGLSACSAADETSPPSEAAPSMAADPTPEEGHCWTLEDEAIDERAGTKLPLAWSGAEPVDCATDHEIITVKVADIPQGTMESFTPETTMDDVTQTTRDFIQSTCGLALSDALQIDDDSLYATFTLQPHIPAPTAWADGDRWLRCDIMRLPAGMNFAAQKSTAAYPLLPASIADMAAQMKADPREYQLCATTPGGQDPFDSQGRRTEVADCTGEYEWRFVSSIKASDEFPAGNPGIAAIEDRGRVLCEAEAPEGVEWYAYWPLEDEWSETATFSCWLRDGSLAALS